MIITIIIVATIIIFFLYLIIEKHSKYKISAAQNKIKKLKEIKNSIPEDLIKFPKYYINLERSKQRNISMINNIKKYNLDNIWRVDAFDGRKIVNINEGIIDGYEYICTDKKCSKNELAITMSHIKTIKKSYENGDQYSIIMEDDNRFTLVPYWEKNISEMIKEMPEDCEVLLLSNRRSKFKGEIELIKANVNDYNGVCYIITKKGMEKASKYLDGTIFKFEEKDIVFDHGILSNFIVYTYTIPFFLLDNFEHVSDRIVKNYIFTDFCHSSYNVLKLYEKNIIDDDTYK